MWNFKRLYDQVIKDRETCMNWLEENGLLQKVRYCTEGHLMTVIFRKNASYGNFRCQKKHIEGSDDQIVSRCIGTWLERVNIPPEKVLLLTMCFVNNMTYDDAIKQSSDFTKEIVTSKSTVACWYKHCREILLEHLLRNSDSQNLSCNNISCKQILASKESPSTAYQKTTKRPKSRPTGRKKTNSRPLVIYLRDESDKLNISEKQVKNIWSSKKLEISGIESNEKAAEKLWRKNVKLLRIDPFSNFIDILRDLNSTD